jgi:hypothetical protein
MEADDTCYVSPDRTLTFVVRRYPDDVVLGFAGMPWHVHGDTLAKLSGCAVEEAIGRFVADLQNGHLVIATARVEGAVRDIFITDNPEQLDRFKPENETVHLRYWDGSPFEPGRANRRWRL